MENKNEDLEKNIRRFYGLLGEAIFILTSDLMRGVRPLHVVTKFEATENRYNGLRVFIDVFDWDKREFQYRDYIIRYAIEFNGHVMRDFSEDFQRNQIEGMFEDARNAIIGKALPDL
jgi:hypothetical protein